MQQVSAQPERGLNLHPDQCRVEVHNRVNPSDEYIEFYRGRKFFKHSGVVVVFYRLLLQTRAPQFDRGRGSCSVFATSGLPPPRHKSTDSCSRDKARSLFLSETHFKQRRETVYLRQCLGLESSVADYTCLDCSLCTETRVNARVNLYVELWVAVFLILLANKFNFAWI